MKTAMLASYEKDAVLVRLGGMLKDAGWDLLGSAGTAKYLNENGITCRDVAEIVGPPILGHRVVTLSREVHAGLLAKDTPEDQAELDRLGIARIDLVYGTLYPLEDTVADAKATPEDVLEKTDMGGPALLRSAAKGRRITLSSPEQIDEFEKKLTNNSLDETYIVRLAAAAERRVANYVAVSASYWEKRV